MTFTHLDDEPLDTLHPLDLLERAVEANGWAFERWFVGRDPAFDGTQRLLPRRLSEQ